MLKIILPLLFATQVHAQLVDRIVLEINSVTYTQRQIELFVAVFDSISNEMNNNVRQLNTTNWKSTVVEFENFMLVEQEAHRLGSYLPSNKMIEKGYEVFASKKETDPNLSGIMKRLSADENSVKKSVISVLRVAAFLRSKQNRSRGNPNGVSDFRRFSEAPWFVQLRDRAIIRYMSGGDTFEPIRSVFK